MRSGWLLGALCLFAASSAAQEIGKVKYVAGAVTVSRSGATQNAAPGDSLQANDIVRTPREAGTGVRIVLLDASELTLGSGTELRVVLHNPETQQTTIEMLHGHLRAKVTPVVKQGGIFQVRTPTAVAVALGTVVQVDTVPVEAANTSAGTVLSERAIENLPGTGRDYSNLVSLTPGTLSPGAMNGLQRQAYGLILDGSTEPAGATSFIGPDMDAISSFSVTNAITGEVFDGAQNEYGAFETRSLSPGPYNIHISTKSGTNSFQGHAFELYGGKQINFFPARSSGPASANAPLRWDYALTPRFNSRETLGAPVLQQRFPNLQPFSYSAAPSGISIPSSAEIGSNASLGASNLINLQTQNYNALTPFAISNPFLVAGTGGTNPDSTATSRSYLSYSRVLSGIGGPIPLPRFGEGSNIAPRPSFRDLYYGQFNYQRSGQEATGSQSSPSDAAPPRGQTLGASLTFDYSPRRDISLFKPAPRLTNTQNFIADFGGQNFATDFSATIGNSVPLVRQPATITDIFPLTQPITDPRVSRNEFGVYGPTWVPTDSGGAPLIHLNPEPNDAVTLNSFNWNLNPIPSFLTGLATSLVQGQSAPASNLRIGTNLAQTPGNWDVLRGIHLNLGSQFSSSYTIGSSGDETAEQLTNPAVPRQARINFGLETPLRLEAGYRSSSPDERFAEPTRFSSTGLNTRAFRWPEMSLGRNSRYSGVPLYNLGEFGNVSRQDHHKYSNFELVSIPIFSQLKYQGLSYKLSDSWCRRYSNYDYKQLQIVDYRALREYYGGIYGYKQPVAPDYTRLTLDDIPAGQTERTAGRIGMWDYTGVSVTVVIALDHWVAVIGYTPGSKTQFAQSGQMIVVRARQAAEPAVAIFNVNGTVATYQQASLKSLPGPENLLRSVLDFNGRGSCVATWVVNGVPLFGGSMSAISYKLMGVGRSTGDAIRVIVTNNSGCAVYFIVMFGTVLQPHSLEHKVSAVAGFLLGGDLNLNNIKSYQIMINFGGMTVVIIVVEAAPAPQHPPELGGPSAEADIDVEPEQAIGNVGEGVLRAYCLELHKLAPHPETRYEFADAKLQDELGPNAAFLQHIFELVQSGALKIPQGHTLDTLIQWTLWASREGMDEGKFKDAYRTLVHHNYDAQKKKWDKDAEKFIEDSEKTLWPAVAVALAAN